MSFARLHKTVTYVIAGFGLYTLTLGGELSGLALVLVGVGFIGSIFAEGEILARPVWIRGWTAGVVLVFALQIARALLGDAWLSLGIEYVAFLQVSRLFNRRTARDHQQIAVIAFLHLIAGTVLTADIGYAFVFVGFVIVAPWMLALSYLRREIEGNYPGVIPRTGPDVHRVLSSRRVVGPWFLAGTAALTVPIFALTIVLFLLFPRVGLGIVSFGSSPGQHTVGFGRNVELGRFGSLRDNPVVVVRVTFPEVSAPPARLAIRLRGTSFDRYDGRRWTRSEDDSEPIRNVGNYYGIARWARADDRRVHVSVDPLDEPVVFLLPGTVGFTIPPRVRNGVQIQRRVHVGPGLDVRYRDGDDLGISYVVHVSDDPSEMLRASSGGGMPGASIRSADETALKDDLRSRYLQLPPATTRISALARTVARPELPGTTETQLAERIEAWLGESGELAYTLDLPDPGDRDPLEVFLFEAKAGHCEYFSTAMAMMLRTLGVPTRNVTGFVGGQYNPYGGYYAVRQGDAHSWVEAYVDGKWVVFDPTPPARDEVRPELLFAELRAFFDAMRHRWNEVVGYDMRDQVDGMRAALAWFRQLRADPDAEASTPGSQDEPGAAEVEERARWPWILAGVAVLVVVAFVVHARRRGPGSDARPSVNEAVSLYRRMERALAKRGHPRSPSRTPAEHAEALTAAGFEHAAAVREVTRRYLEVRFGDAPLAPGERARLLALIRTLGN